MKASIFTLACLLALTPLARASVSVQLDCGALQNATGTATEPVGGLLQLIASPSGVFAPATSSSYVSGDNVVVLDFPMNDNFGTGETNNVLDFNLATTGTTVGEDVQLRWFPLLTAVLNSNTGLYDPSSAAPGIGTMYGQFRSDTGQSNGKGTGIPWTIPADGTTLTTPGGWNFVTMSNGGPNANTLGYATLTVIPVPEPASYSLGICFAAAGLIGWRLRRQLWGFSGQAAKLPIV